MMRKLRFSTGDRRAPFVSNQHEDDISDNSSSASTIYDPGHEDHDNRAYLPAFKVRMYGQGFAFQRLTISVPAEEYNALVKAYKDNAGIMSEVNKVMGRSRGDSCERYMKIIRHAWFHGHIDPTLRHKKMYLMEALKPHLRGPIDDPEVSEASCRVYFSIKDGKLTARRDLKLDTGTQLPASQTRADEPVPFRPKPTTITEDIQREIDRFFAIGPRYTTTPATAEPAAEKAVAYEPTPPVSPTAAEHIANRPATPEVAPVATPIAAEPEISKPVTAEPEAIAMLGSLHGSLFSGPAMSPTTPPPPAPSANMEVDAIPEGDVIDLTTIFDNPRANRGKAPQPPAFAIIQRKRKSAMIIQTSFEFVKEDPGASSSSDLQMTRNEAAVEDTRAGKFKLMRSKKRKGDPEVIDLCEV
ncbi:hypothetical protein B0T25DRAFT_559623 [Lasiosphaeria hispida]|uniref:Uncharacterized protein n=1 Tax=Lasiosphaeria hispida TaxID=260671 RepID=A0AAJ0H773_9PEZI|nr:hypothetical protein B0T25DRAFT_559623 [Lasiosphaeria hispida]